VIRPVETIRRKNARENTRTGVMHAFNSVSQKSLTGPGLAPGLDIVGVSEGERRGGGERNEMRSPEKGERIKTGGCGRRKA
jgi:hypothetical protein